MKIISIIGARPQFIKLAPLCKEIEKQKEIQHIILHTGQHFEHEMSEIFFEQMSIRQPDYNLNINSFSHGKMTGKMIETIEDVLLKEKPEWVILFGDTNSTLAGAIAASKLQIKIAHIEAGLRSFNMEMPEEINRILTDRVSKLLFCPTIRSVENLNKEGFNNFDCEIVNSGDIMYDAKILFEKKSIEPQIDIPQKFALVTIHRQENTSDKKKLKSLVSAINKLSENIEIIAPLHPGTFKQIQLQNLAFNKNIIVSKPLGYLELSFLLKNASLILTDSGGLQKEAYFHKKSCIILREETEWTELVDKGYNFITGSDPNKINEYFNIIMSSNIDFKEGIYGKGNTSRIVVNKILQN